MKKLISIVTVVVVAFGMLSIPSLGFAKQDIVKSYAATTAVKAPTGVHAKKINVTTLQVWWKKVDGASGYSIYRWNGKKI